MFEKLKIISVSIHRLSFHESLDKVMEWGFTHTPSYVCFANVHMTIEAYKDPRFLEQLNKASLVVADGKPIAVASGILYGKKQERMSGMDFMPRILEEANAAKATIFLSGSSDHVLEALQKKITNTDPAVKIGGERIELLKPVRFGYASAQPLRNSEAILAQIAATLRAERTIARVVIRVHVHRRGSDDLALSQRRADALRSWLVAHGIEAERVAAEGRGSSNPLVAPGSSGAASSNDRVEILISSWSRVD